ncbi:MAG: ROK family protein [Atopobiaceae bacterium]|nr:ROK family protein [Atopobiaceae bacterium]
MAEQYLVLDIGGTYIKYAIMNRGAQFIEKGKFPAATDSEEAMLESLRGLKDEVVNYDYEGVAISMPGRIDTERGWAHTGGAFTWLNEYPAAEKYGGVFGKPCTIANDGKCAALAESWMGALADVDSGCVIVLGTGIGGGIVLNRQVWMGCSGGAGELSWFGSNFDGLRDMDGFPHHMSDVWCGRISANTITSQFAKAKGLDRASGVMLFDAYEAGDPEAVAIIEEYAVQAAAGIFSLQCVLDLPRYAIGGGISARPETTSVVRDKLNEIYDRRSGIPFSRPEVVTCKFGNEANLIGALAFHLRAGE